jgi:hypothetical protein
MEERKSISFSRVFSWVSAISKGNEPSIVTLGKNNTWKYPDAMRRSLLHPSMGLNPVLSENARMKKTKTKSKIHKVNIIVSLIIRIIRLPLFTFKHLISF